MKTLKRFVLLPLFCGLLLTTACTEQYENDNGIDNGYYNGDDNGNGDTSFNRTITAEVVNGNNYDDIISTVGIKIWADDRSHTIATGTWANGGFTTTLPETIDADEFFIAFLRREKGINISDTSARTVEVSDISAYDEQQRRIGIIWYGDADWRYEEMRLLYVDRDVTIIGTGTFSDIGQRHTYNLQLRAGWNRIYIISKKGEGEAYNGVFYISTEPISGLRWHFHYWGQ